MDGVLVTGFETASTVYAKATESLLLAFGEEHPLEWSSALENPDSATEFREACKHWNLPPRAAWGYRERTASYLEERRIDNRKRDAFADTDVLSSLGDAYALGIASNNRHDTVAYCTVEFGWREHISVTRGRFPVLEEYDRMKPHPRFLAWTLDQLAAERALFVGDRSSDVTTANRVGCKSALLVRDGTVPDENANPTWTIETLEELLELAEAGWPQD